MIDEQPARLEVLVLRVVSPLDTGSLHGRGQGLLRRDPGVGVTFLLDQSDFTRLREHILTGDGEVRHSVAMTDVTAIDTALDRASLAPLPMPLT